MRLDNVVKGVMTGALSIALFSYPHRMCSSNQRAMSHEASVLFERQPVFIKSRTAIMSTTDDRDDDFGSCYLSSRHPRNLLVETHTYPAHLIIHALHLRNVCEPGKVNQEARQA